MIQIEVRPAPRQKVRIGQTGAIVLGRITRDGERLGNRVVDRLPREIRGACVTAARADVDRDADPFVAVVGDGLGIAFAYGDRQTERLGDLRLSRARPTLTRHAKHLIGDGGQRILGQREARGGCGERQSGRIGHLVGSRAHPKKTNRGETGSNAALGSFEDY